VLADAIARGDGDRAAALAAAHVAAAHESYLADAPPIGV
jgi:DNA-binding GntR family transcriptional regulator